MNHCSVRASSTVNGVETHQIFLYGGQHLNQSDRDSAVYVLDLPSWTWTFVGNLSGAPAGRAGHQCVLDGSQLVVIGGLVASNVLCDQPVRRRRCGQDVIDRADSCDLRRGCTSMT